VFPHDTAAVSFYDSWGSRRSGGRRHKGTDIISPRGTEVLAVAAGVVTEMSRSRLSGYFIRIEHEDDWTTSYLHLNNDTLGTDDGEGGEWTAFFPTLMEGDEVIAGQVIGYVGDSGNAEGTVPHTHFEVNHDGHKENPYDYLEDAWLRETVYSTEVLLPR
jgi:murein DD-endopeptidase MepM/ murein hydrolase activator NlpD